MIPLVPAIGPVTLGPTLGATIQRRPLPPAPPPVPAPKTLGETFDELLGFSPTLGDVLRLVGHGFGSWVGIYVGLNGKSNWVRFFGWAIGIGQGLTGICDVVSLAQRAARHKETHTTEETQMAGRRPWRLV